MKIFRTIIASSFVAAISTASVCAQQQPARPAATPVPVATGSVPESKIALLNSDAFADEKNGITKLVAAMKRVDSEFTPRKTALQTLQQQIEKATADLQKAAPVQDPKVTQQQNDKIEQMKKDFQRQGEDAQAAYQKRWEEALGPIQDEIGKALDLFAKAHGITLILDVTKFQGIVSASDSLDITAAFIREFNSKNPSTASLTTPPK
jgi:outer membrane protein